MGLFDFAKNIGHKLFPSASKPEDAAAVIRREIEEANLGIVGLGVTYADGKCHITGKAPSNEAMEKAVLIAGNIEGVSNVDITGLQVPAPAAAAAPAEVVDYYVIVAGDTLSKLAKRYYGDANQYNRIFEANREVIKDPNKIFPGQKIRIPKARVPTA
ncbi:MAG: peptidoglycan-binding protein LysM [Pseudomonadota bacterium]|nr:peptidoglycan-binding protein LysM [Pseudomonadota bacterium]